MTPFCIEEAINKDAFYLIFSKIFTIYRADVKDFSGFCCAIYLIQNIWFTLSTPFSNSR